MQLINTIKRVFNTNYLVYVLEDYPETVFNDKPTKTVKKRIFSVAGTNHYISENLDDNNTLTTHSLYDTIAIPEIK